MATNSYHCTDLGNSKFFRDFVNGNLIYNYRTQTWYEWTGKKWKACTVGHEVEWAKGTIRAMLKHAATISDSDERRQYAAWAIKSESEKHIKAMMNLARSESGIADSGEDWDIDPYMLGCPSGVLDLKTGNLLAPDKKTKLISSIAIKPDDKARCPQWEQFLQEIYMGDAEIIGFVKRLLGYALTGTIEEQCVFCFHGQGANGKSTLTDTIIALMGNYGYPMPFSTIEFQNRSAISNDMAHLYGKRFVVASETQEGVRLNEGRLKSLTGGDMVTARFMYKEYFSFKPMAHFLLAFNHKPIITDDSEGAWRRIYLIAHNRIFKSHERDKKLDKKLLKELPGILNWLIEGCMEWQRDGLMVPQSVIAGTEEYRQEMNPLRNFVEDDLVTGDYCARVTDIWAAYNTWSDENRERFRLSQRKFNSRLESMGFKRQAMRIANGGPEKCWIGIGLGPNPITTKHHPQVTIN